MTGVAAGAGTGRDRVAQIVTDVMDPVVPVILATLVVAVHAAGLGRGVELGLVALFFAVGIPYAVLVAGVRKGRLGNRYVSQRKQRPALMGIALVSVLAALLAMRLMDAPRGVFALVGAMVAGLAVCLGISLVWKVSIHAACVAGAVAALATLVHPAFLAFTPLVALVGWARVVVKGHTVGQVVAGALVGGVVAAVVSAALS